MGADYVYFSGAKGHFHDEARQNAPYSSAVCISSSIMTPRRDEVVKALRAMSRYELVETVYEALQVFDQDEYRLRVAQSYQTYPGESPDVEFIALPVDGHERPGVDELYQQGLCDKCGTRIVSVAKLACCPMCASEVYCT